MSIPGKIAISASYVYFASFSDAIISRAPRAGGPIEKLMPAGELVKADLITQPWLSYATPIRIHGSWVYFASATPGGGIAIARLPADSPSWSAADAEILTRPAGELDFIVDDEALYWIECDDPMTCATSTLKALVIPP